MRKSLVLACLSLCAPLLPAAGPPAASISNGPIRAAIYLPDAKTGFYRGTRFDWSGVVYSLEFKGHQFYGPWFNKTRPEIRDFLFEGSDIVAGPCSAITGPVDEFRPLGFDEAGAGATFVKIGVGALRKPDGRRYDNYRVYEIADGGNWNVARKRDAVVFTQRLSDASSGYGYTYRKTVRLEKSKPVMVLEHALKNTGTKAIRTTVYNHNFLVLDRQTTGEGFTVTVPYKIASRRAPDKRLAEVRENRIVYLKALEGRDVVSTPADGFSADPAATEVRIESSKAGAGVRFISDRPLASQALWSIRTVIAMEPFTAIAVEPGAEFTWTTTYDYYTLSPGAK